MTRSEETRHTARQKLVESSALEEDDRLWLPGNPLEEVSRGYMYTAPDYYQSIMAGRTPEWKRRYWAMNALLLMVGVGFISLSSMFILYGPNIGLVPAVALFLTGVAFLGVTAFLIVRSLTNLEYGLRISAQEDSPLRRRKDV